MLKISHKHELTRQVLPRPPCHTPPYEIASVTGILHAHSTHSTRVCSAASCPVEIAFSEDSVDESATVIIGFEAERFALQAVKDSVIAECEGMQCFE
uniref:Uncharacterized protein n=1 Tax=Wuchereria bancrofti TaxID=6293 RepID=A0AAF5PWX2_WUCBA